MSRFKYALCLVLTSVFLASIAVGPAMAKKKKEAILAGTVKNPTGDALEQVQIQVVDAEGAMVAQGATDRKGEFKMELPAGQFVVHFTGSGYAPFQGEVDLESGIQQDLSITLLDEAAGRRNRAIEAYNAGAAAHREHDLPTALAKFEEAIAADDGMAPPFLALADVHLQQGNPEAAVTAIERFLELEPEDEQGKKLAFEAYRRAGMTEKAEATAAELGDQDMSKDLAIGIYNEGAIASQKGDYDTALAKFREAAALDPALAQANAGAAAILYNQEKLDEALAAAELSLATDPENRQGLRIRYLVYDGRGEIEKAYPAWDAYRGIDEDGAVQLLYTRADMEFQAGEVDAARQALTKVLQFRPDFARAHYTMGLTYTASDPVKAKEHLQKFLELAPEDPEAPTAKEILSYL